MKRISFWATCFFGILGIAVSALAQFTIENPPPGSTQSGIGLISGWKCTGKNLTAVIDGVHTLALVYGSERLDTQGACGDANNGIGLLVNWNLLSNGQHVIEFFDNGVKFATIAFTVQTLGSQFLTGKSKTVAVSNFPNSGQTTTLTWSESAQNFVIMGLSGGSGNALSDLRGHWEFRYTILSTFFQDLFFLHTLGTLSTGAPYLAGDDEEDGLPVIVARTKDFTSAPFPYDFIMIDPDLLTCDLFFFNQSGDTVQGIEIPTLTDPVDVCDLDFIGTQHAMVGTRTAAAISKLNIPKSEEDKLDEIYATEALPPFPKEALRALLKEF